MTCRIHRQVTAERLSQIRPDDPGPDSTGDDAFTQRDHDKAGGYHVLSVLFFGALAFGLVWLGVDWGLHASGILPHK